MQCILFFHFSVEWYLLLPLLTYLLSKAICGRSLSIYHNDGHNTFPWNIDITDCTAVHRWRRRSSLTSVVTRPLLRKKETGLSTLPRKGKSKAIQLQAWTGPEGSRRLRHPDIKTMAHECGKVVSPTHRSHLSSSKYSWYSFLLGAESTPGP